MHHTLREIIEHKGTHVHSVAPSATVVEAVRRMNEERIGCLLVRDDEQVVGIFTERDVLTRVVDRGLDPGAVRVSEVMTTDPVSVRPSLTVHEAMAVVTEKRCRHLPVLEEERLVGMVSIGDLTRWVVRDQAIHIQHLVDYITGRYPR
jgi:CBS domain-containing protein